MNGKLPEIHLQEFLRRFGIMIYTGDRAGDLVLIEDEVKELWEMGLIDKDEYLQVMAALMIEKKKYHS